MTNQLEQLQEERGIQSVEDFTMELLAREGMNGKEFFAIRDEYVKKFRAWAFFALNGAGETSGEVREVITLQQ